WVITTNPLREARDRLTAFQRNLSDLCDLLESQAQSIQIVRTASDYFAARQQGKHAAFLAVQGGNAFGDTLVDVRDSDISKLLLVPLIHLSQSELGAS